MKRQLCEHTFLPPLAVTATPPGRRPLPLAPRPFPVSFGFRLAALAASRCLPPSFLEASSSLSLSTSKLLITLAVEIWIGLALVLACQHTPCEYLKPQSPKFAL